MNFWQWLHNLGPGWPTARGWYAAALCLQTCVIIWMVAAYPGLGTNEFFKTLATAIVITGWIGFAVSGRDNRLDREQVGEAHKLASEALAGWRDAQPLPLTNVIPEQRPGEDR
jgi:hypothetical protein